MDRYAIALGKKPPKPKKKPRMKAEKAVTSEETDYRAMRDSLSKIDDFNPYLRPRELRPREGEYDKIYDDLPF